MAHDLFISYSTKDKAAADAVCARMEGGGIRCWYAPRDIEPGADWAGSIVDAINVSRVMVLIFTPHSNISKQVLREVDCAVSAGVTIIPLRLTREEPIESMRYYLSAVHWLDAVDAKLDASIDELYDLCKAVIDTGEAALPQKESTVVKKKLDLKTLLSIAAAVLVLAVLAAFLLPKLMNKDTGETMPGTTVNEAAETASETGPEMTETETEPVTETTEEITESETIDVPVGEKSRNAGIEPEHYIEGTTQSNIQFGGFIAYDDGWYYFRSNDDEKLYKMREDGSEAQKISDHSARKIMVHEGYVYFEEEHGYVGIYRVSVNGEDEMQLYGSDVSFMGIIDDKLYYMDYMDGLCAIDLTQDFDQFSWGGDTVYYEEKVAEDIYQMCFDGETIYYIGLHDNGIRRVSINGGEPEVIVKSFVTDPVLAGGYLYFTDVMSLSLKAYELDTGRIIKVVPYMMEYYHVRADGIYGQRSDDGILVKYDPSTGVTYELSDRQVAYVCLANERIFYWDFYKYYSTDLKGKSMITL